MTFPRLSALFRRSRMESDLAEELRFHVESRTDDLMRSAKIEKKLPDDKKTDVKPDDKKPG